MTLNHQGVHACKHSLTAKVALGGLIELLLEYFLKVNSVLKIWIILVIRSLNM